MIFYHGTRESRIPAIEKEGLKKPFLSDQEELANEFTYPGEEAIVVLDLTEEDLLHLRPDARMYRDPTPFLLWKYKMDRETFLDQEGEPHIPRPSHSSDWRTSLKAVHSVIYDGAIPPDRIVEIWTRSSKN